MTADNVEIERIVREVMRRLRQTPSQNQMDDSATDTAGPVRRAADENLPPRTLPSPPLSRGAGGGEGTFESAPGPTPSANRSGLEIRQHVISLAALKGRLDGSRCVRILRGAIVTPSAHDELRKRGIGIEYLTASAGTKSETKITEVLLATWQTTHCPRAFLDAMGVDGRPVTRLDLSDGPQSLVRALADATTETNRLGVLLTDKPSLALCLVNRPPCVRAAWGLDARSVAEASSSLAANLLVVEPARHSLPAMMNMTRTFLGSGGGTCPEIVKQSAAVGG